MNKDHSQKLFVYTGIMLLVGIALVPIIPAGQLESCPKPEGYDLVIIAPKIFENEVQPLVRHKNHLGVSTKLVTLEDVYEEMFWDGRDCAEKIKYFIKTAIEEWGTKYMLLVGGKKGQSDSWYCPVRYVQMDDNWESQYISDLYFADIYDSEGNFSSWDSDGDGLYGEWYYGEEPEDKDIDLYPDVAVGRLACRNTQEVKIMVNKIKTYETEAYGKRWFSDMIAVAGDTYPESQNPNWTGYEGEEYANQALLYMTDFDPIRLYTSDGSLSGQRDVISALSNGCGFVYFVGHGNPQTWGNHPPDDEEFVDGLTTKSMSRLTNREKLPICVVSGCHNCQFDVTLLNLLRGVREQRLEFFQWEFFLKEWIPECWGWKLTRKLGGGSVATIGSTALGYTKEDKESFVGGMNEMEVEFFKQYGQNNIDIVGDTFNAAVAWYLDIYPIDWNTAAVSDSWIDAKVVQSWVLFGDPSLMIGGYP